jgi:antitoxin ParD1/3/4
MNVSLTPQLAKLVNDQVASGKYGSASEVVRAALRLLMEQESKREWLVRELQIGLDASSRGESGPLDFDKLITDGEDRIKSEKKESA